MITSHSWTMTTSWNRMPCTGSPRPSCNDQPDMIYSDEAITKRDLNESSWSLHARHSLTTIIWAIPISSI